MRRYLLLMALLAFGLGAWAQVTEVKGLVLDAADGQPLIGATVRVDGTKKMTATDAEGRFTLSGLTAAHQQITVTSIGYETQTQKATKEMTFSLSTTVQRMDEVVVVAFGKQKREAFTGSATVVNAAEIGKQLVNNPIEALNGRVTGMQMTETNSISASTTPTIRIRGFSSLNASNQPLIVLDGMPYSGYLNDINPADIESMTVLKDAASNALYGARGANGVILITTKNAQRGRTKVTFDLKWGANTDGRQDYDYITNPGQYYEAHYLALRNSFQYRYASQQAGVENMTFDQAHARANELLSAQSSKGGLAYIVFDVPENQYLIGTNGRLNPYATLGNTINYNGEQFYLTPDDWYAAGTRTGFRQEYNLNISGGSDKYSILTSLGYMDNTGIAKGSELQRVTARIKTTYQAYSFLRIGANAGYTNTNSSSASGVFSTRYGVAPIFPLYIRNGQGQILTDANGKRFDYGNYDVGLLRPIQQNTNSIQADLLDMDKNSSNAFNISGNATIDILKDLHFTINGSVYITENRMKSAFNPFYGYDQEIGGIVEVSHYRTMDQNYQQLLNYSPKFGDHSLDLLAGHEYSRNTQTSLYGTKDRVADYNQNTELAGAIITGSTSSTKSLYNVEGWFGRAQYDYASRYFASASFRRDGSSRFHPDHRWGNFWSLGAAWIATKENWWPKTTWLNMLKVKASYGEQGNDGIGSFRYTDLYNISNTNDQVALTFTSRGNKTITWETVGSFNAGFEFDLFNSRLTGGLDYYYRKTSDMLMWLTTPYEIGYDGYYDNVGDMSNTGIELELNGTIINTPHITWTLGGNLTWQRNKILYIPEEKQAKTMDGHPGYLSGGYFYGEGLSMYTIYSKEWAGVSENGEGMWYKTDADGKKVATTKYDNADYYLVGCTLPKVFGGFNTTLNIYGVDISAMFNYSIGGVKTDSGYSSLMSSPAASSTGKGLHKDVFDCWTPENKDSKNPMFFYNDQTGGASSRFLTDASFLSLRNVTVGYTLPRPLTQRWKLQDVRISATCENVAYWTARKGFDPRTSITGSLYGGYAPMRTFALGLKLQF